MRLVEVLPLIRIQRPFDAQAEHKKQRPDFHYYGAIRRSEAIAEVDRLTRHYLDQDEFLMITVLGSTYLERGKNLDMMQPLAFFHTTFGCGFNDGRSETLADALVNMTKQEVCPEIRSLIYGEWPAWRSEYAGLKILLCRKTAVIPDYLLGQNLPIVHLPESGMPSSMVNFRPKQAAIA